MASAEIILERSFYIGIVFTAILYGIQLYMYFHSLYYLATVPGSRQEKKFYIVYGFVLLVLLAIASGANAVFGQLMWIEHRDVVGGPAQFLADNTAAWYNTFGSAADVAANVMGDALLLYRCYMFWSSHPYVVALPGLVFLASTAMAIITVIESALPGASIFQGSAVQFGVSWVSLTVAYNVLVTILICTRLLYLHKQIRTVLSPEAAQMYTGIVAMMIESAAPFSILGIAFVISYSRTSPTEFAFAQVWGIFVALSPQLIILRVAMGRAWNKETVSRVTSGSIVFSTGNDEVKSHTELGQLTTKQQYSEGTAVSFQNSNKSGEVAV